MAESAKDENTLASYLEFQMEMNSSADMLYDIFRSKCDVFPRLVPEDLKNVEMLSVDVWLWTFVDGKCGTWKNSVKGDKEIKSVTWTLLEGEVPKKLYKALKVDYLFISTDKGCKVKVKLTYEKNDITVPPPNSYVEFIRKLIAVAANNPLEH